MAFDTMPLLARSVFILLGCALTYAAVLVFYRLKLHPLAKFPGPRLAAATKWYEFYFDLLREDGGRFAWEITRMHEIYGPIVRINPDELHVKDPDWYDVLYSGKPAQRDKWSPAARMAGTPLASFGTVDHKTHQERRGANSNFFSNATIANAEPLVRSHVDELCTILRDSYIRKQVVELQVGFLAYSTDTLSRYGFGEAMHLQSNPDKAREWTAATQAVAEATPLVKQFPWIIDYALKIPLRLIRAVNPVLARLLAVHHYMFDHASTFIKGQQDTSNALINEKDLRAPTLFQIIQQSSLPAHEKSVKRLAQEGFTVLVAGSETTARVLTLIVYHLLANEDALARLMKELMEVMPDFHSAPSVRRLKELPWLTAVIKEAMRVSAIQTSRLPLQAPNELRYREWKIPAKTPVSMTVRDVLHDPSIFDNPLAFAPERWLTGAEKVSPLNRYFVAFSKGTRGCPGMQFAYAELYLAIATIFRRFEFELHDTVHERDVAIARDFFVGSPGPDGRGVRVRIVRERV